MGNVIVKVTNLNKKYGRVIAVHDVSFEIVSANTYGLIGPNGAGKSSIIKMICGLISPDSGNVYILDKHVVKMNCSSDIGYLPSTPFFRPHIRVREYLMMVNDFKYNGKKIDDVDYYIDSLGLTGYKNTIISQLSYGNQRKLGIATAMIGTPNLIILDEPTNGLDTEATIVLKELIRRATNKGSAVLLATHILDFAQNVCDYSIFIKDGMIAEITDACTNFEEKYKHIFLEGKHA